MTEHLQTHTLAVRAADVFLLYRVVYLTHLREVELAGKYQHICDRSIETHRLYCFSLSGQQARILMQRRQSVLGMVRPISTNLPLYRQRKEMVRR